MLKSLIATLSIFSCAVLSVTAQEKGVFKSTVDNGYFNHLEISASVGSPGIGIDVAAPMGDYLKLRAGITYMPQMEMTSGFRVQVGDSLEKKFDKQGNRIETKFDKMSGLLKSLTGFEVDDEIDMLIKPTYYNFRLLVDVLPFRNKNWHFTAGFYVGNSTIGRAYNTTEDMPSLMAVSMYNNMYDAAKDGRPFVNYNGLAADVPPEVAKKFLEYGRMGVQVGFHLKDGPVYYNEHAVVQEYEPDGTPIYDWDNDGNPIHEPVELDKNGNPRLTYYKGDPYMMVPGKDGMVKVKAKANRFKPYVGFGYGGPITKDGLTEFSFDAGVLFWGGKPHVYTHDGTDLIYDVEKIGGKVGSYVKAIKCFPVFPVLEVRVTRRIF